MLINVRYCSDLAKEMFILFDKSNEGFISQLQMTRVLQVVMIMKYWFLIAYIFIVVLLSRETEILHYFRTRPLVSPRLKLLKVHLCLTGILIFVII